MRAVFGALFILALAGCGEGSEPTAADPGAGDPCGDILCESGWACDPMDGLCKCGGAGGAVCEPGQMCVAENGTSACVPPADLCADVTCGIAGTACDPSDGLCKCGDAGPACRAGQVCLADQQRCQVPECTAGTRYASPTTVFREATAEWGLTGVVGTRVAVTDIDGDGWADLLVRRGGNGADDFNPDGTRRTWLMKNEGGQFTDVTVSSGLRQTRTHPAEVGRPGEVVASADVDNDGDLDVYTGMFTDIENALSGETSELMLNDGTGRFTLTDPDHPLRRRPDAVGGVTFVDYDRDGNIDLWIGQNEYTAVGARAPIYVQDRLFRGDGAGGFADVTAEAGLTTESWSQVDPTTYPVVDEGQGHSRAWSSAACDLNDDGTPELLVASYGRTPNHLWVGQRGDEGTTFTNRSVASGYAFDADQRWQLNQFARCYCQSNALDAGCQDAPAPNINCRDWQRFWSPVRDRNPFRLGGNSGTTVCADVNNDGRMDLVTHEITHWWAGANSDRSELLLNTGDPEVRFERPGLVPTGLERGNPQFNWDNGDMTGAVFDFDNDGWPDVYIGASDYAGNHGLLFHQSMPLAFTEVPVAEGIDHNRSHGVAVADFDRDGDLDLVVGHSRARCNADAPNNCYPTQQVRLFENVLGDQGNWVQLKLQGGAGTNRAAIGARVSVTAGGVTQTQEVGGGHGHYGLQNDLVLHFGLGSSCEAEVTVRWPDATLTTQTFIVDTGGRYEIVQGSTPIRL